MARKSQSVKYQTQRIKRAVGQSGQTTERFSLDAQFNKAVGYALFEYANPGVPYRIKVEDEDNVYQHFTSYKDYMATPDVPKNQRYSPCDIPAKSNYVTVSIEFLETTTAALDIDFVFLLQD